MDLISCPQCGVVLDKNRLMFSEVYDRDTQEVDTEHAVWDGEKYVAIVNCPVCRGEIREE